MKIRIYTPKEKGKWRFKIGEGGLRSRANVNTLYNALEGRLPSLVDKEKLAIMVKYDIGTNETLKSQDTHYLLYSLGCFLEDYLSPITMRRIERSYLSV